jgi:tetratricopeptide (TPR) repeat protein
MQRSIWFAFLTAGLLVGCSQQAPGPRQVATPPDDDSNGPFKTVVAGPATTPSHSIDGAINLTEPANQDRYDASLMRALDLLAQKKQTEALAALVAAMQDAPDAAGIQHEIDRLQESMNRQAAAEATAQSIRAILDDGRPVEAAQLAGQALAQYGGSDSADDLLKLKHEADALAGAQTGAVDQRRKARAEAEAALEAKNLRGAAVALEQALRQGDDAELKKQSDDVRDRLSRYDDNRRRAEELRHDPSSIEEAVAALQDAQKAWDTFEVQQQIAEYSLALQNRRDRIGVADFEVRGDVGLADAGRTLAEELLPAFKSRYDLLERGQLNKVVDELKLETSDLNGNQNQAEVGRIAKLRYLVVGSVSRLGGVTVNARLVDVRSGLVVQTARASAPTAEDLLPLLPQMAAVLMMSDEQKLAYEQQLSQHVALAPPVPAEPAPLPPPPELRQDDQPPPPPIVTATPFAPPPGDIRPEDFQRLAPPPPPGQPPVVIVEERVDAPVRLRLGRVAVELGDNLFRRRRFREANVQFELALNLGSDRRDLELRIDRCRPFLPPPPPPEIVVVAPPPPRPRIAILDLAVIGNPNVVPPTLGAWTADNIAPYFCPTYDVVDRETVCWYMNRLGLSLRDVLTDPIARRWLGRALGVRFFVLGDVRETASFVVTTHLVDAECGYEYGWGSVHVQSPLELRLRLGELAGQTLLDPAERQRRQQEAEFAERERRRLAELAEADRLRALQESQNVPLLVLEAQRLGDGGNLSVSIELLGRARRLRPDNIEVSVLFNRFNDRNQRQEGDGDRNREWERRQTIVAAAQQQQLALARAAEESRLLAAQQAAARQAADSQILEQQRQQAFLQLQAQAQLAAQQQQFSQSVQLYQSALALKQTDEVYQALAQAQARAAEAERQLAANVAAQQAAALQQQRDAEAAAARQQLLEARRNQESREQADRAARAARDQALYQRMLDDAQRQLANEQYDSAISALQTARQMRRTDEVDRLLSQALVEQARATALKTNPAGQADLERQLADEKARREKAEAEAARNRDLYETSLKLAQKAFAAKDYGVAEAKYEEAGKVYNTDVVLTSLRTVRAAKTEDAAAAAAAQAKRDADAKKAADFQRLSDVGVAALEQKQYDRAVKMLGEANQVKPDDVKVLTALTKANHEQADAALRAQREAESARQETAFRQVLDGGKANLAAKHYDAAAASLKEALRMKPADKDAAAALQAAEKARAEIVQSEAQQAQAKKNADAYQKAMTDARAALTAKQYDVAAISFGEAQKLMPGDASSTALLQQAAAAKANAAAVVAEVAKQRADEQQRASVVQTALAQSRAAMAARDLNAAGKAVAVAAEKAPNDPEVKKALADLQTALNAKKAEDAARQQRADQLQALKKKGADAQAARRYDEAVQAFAEASQLAPDDAGLKASLNTAQKALADGQAIATQAAAQKASEARAAQVGQMTADARNALAKSDYDGAGKLLLEARKLAPNDLRVNQAQADLAKASKETADRVKKQHDDYTLAMGAGKAAVREGDYQGAINSYTESLRIVPGDKEAATALQGAQQAKASADVAGARMKEQAKRRDDFAKLMTQGQTAMTAKQYATASAAFTEALKVQPNDPTATRAQRDANQAAADAVRLDAKMKADADAKMKADETKRQADVARLAAVQAAQAKAAADANVKMKAEQAKRKTDADAKTKADADAKMRADEAKKQADAALLAAAQAAQAKAAAAEKMKRDADNPATADAARKAAEARRQTDVVNLMTQGQTALTGKKYDDAIKAYSAALQLQPGDAKASAGLHGAQFSAHMAQGQALGAAKKFADAAKEYDAALAIFPDNPDAKAALKRAKANMP